MVAGGPYIAVYYYYYTPYRGGGGAVAVYYTPYPLPWWRAGRSGLLYPLPLTVVAGGP